MISKFMKNQRKNHAKIKVAKCRQQWRQNTENSAPNGTRNHQQIDEKSHQKLMLEHICQKVGKIASKVTPIGAKKREARRRPGPGVPVRGKEFLPETPGSRFAIANHHHTNNHQASK